MKHYIIAFSLAWSVSASAGYSWMNFFTTWNEFNRFNRQSLFRFSKQQQEEDSNLDFSNFSLDSSSDIKPFGFDSPPITSERKEPRLTTSTRKEPILTLSDIKGGVPQAVYDIRDYLLDPEAFVRAGAPLPRGILFVGPPGTGKTTIARALAAEVNIPLIATSGSQFVEIYVGTGPKRVRELFQEARSLMEQYHAPHAIIFIDEIDGIGNRKNRFGSMEDHKTINELLTQMDGFTKDTRITVIAATNCVERLDKALLRPGRFDEIVTIPLPDAQARLEILKFYLYTPQFNRTVGKNITLDALVRETEGWSGAELEALANKAATLVARDKRIVITQADLNRAYTEIKKMRMNKPK